MAYDGLFIHSLLTQLDNDLVGGKLTKIYQPFSYDLVLNFRKDRKNRKLLISANAQNPRFYITDENIVHHTAYEMNLKPRVSSNFCAARISPMFPSLMRSGRLIP